VLTIGCIPCSIKEGREFGVMEVDSNRRIVAFEEKPQNPKPIPGDPAHCLASMGIYVFNTNFLFEQLCQDATNGTSAHDFGKNIIPSLIQSKMVRAFPFQDKNTGRSLYWRDVGTLDSYYEANMDLVAVEPELNLYDRSWPLRTYTPQEPPPKFVFAQTAGANPRSGHALDSLVCSGSILSGGAVRRSVLGYNVRVNSWASVEESILFDGVEIGRNCKIR
jgi:glucose-1-phosphate adenylyltransferase